MRKKTAFITGIAGQDGAYLTQFLVSKNYAVHGLMRWDSYPDIDVRQSRLKDLGCLDGDLTLHEGDLTDLGNILALLQTIQPDEIYNLAGLTHVKVSFDTPASTFDINTKGTLNILEAVRILDIKDRVKIYQASSSEMFGSSPAPQNEETPFHPCSPYGVSKLAAYWLAKTYRDSYGIFAANGILFNHESPYRGRDFVTQKIAQAAADFKSGRTAPLRLGNLDARRDWGHARDYVRGMWLMVQHDMPDDFVLATGQSYSVRQCAEAAFTHVALSLEWEGEGEQEIARDARSGRVVIEVDPALYRPSEVNALLGDPSKAKTILKWEADIEFPALIAEMVEEAKRS